MYKEAKFVPISCICSHLLEFLCYVKCHIDGVLAFQTAVLVSCYRRGALGQRWSILCGIPENGRRALLELLHVFLRDGHHLLLAVISSDHISSFLSLRFMQRNRREHRTCPLGVAEASQDFYRVSVVIIHRVVQCLLKRHFI